jgi:hypothetical protein
LILLAKFLFASQSEAGDGEAGDATALKLRQREISMARMLALAGRNITD